MAVPQFILRWRILQRTWNNGEWMCLACRRWDTDLYSHSFAQGVWWSDSKYE